MKIAHIFLTYVQNILKAMKGGKYMKVKECMCNELCCVNSNTKIWEVAKLMGDNHVGSVLISNADNKICGIVTDRDITLRGVANKKDFEQTPISDIMTTKVCTCDEEDEVCDAQDTMSEYQIRRLPVCDCNNNLVGIITTGNLAQNSKELGQKEVTKTFENICQCKKNQRNAE